MSDINFKNLKKGSIFYESGQRFGNILSKVIKEPYQKDNFLYIECICVDGEDSDIFNKTFKFNLDSSVNYFNPSIYSSPAYIKVGCNFSDPWIGFNKSNHPEFFEV